MFTKYNIISLITLSYPLYIPYIPNMCIYYKIYFININIIYHIYIRKVDIHFKKIKKMQSKKKEKPTIF